MRDQAVRVSRPERTSDGAGGSTEVPGTSTLVWASVALDRETVTMLVDAAEDIRVGDLVEVAYD